MKRLPLDLHRAPRFTWLAAASWLLATGLCGCGSDPLGPPVGATGASLESRGGTHDTRGFFPLATGNRWSYRATDTADDGIHPPSDFHYRFDYRVLGREARGGHRYSVLEVRLFFPPFEEPFVGRLLLRQDRAGLYQRILPPPALGLERASASAAPVSVGAGATSRHVAEAMRGTLERRLASLPGVFPDHRRRGGPADSELVILRYPLHRGARWAPSPGAPKIVVVGRDRLRLPAGKFEGFRLRLPDLPAHFEWYGRAGFLKEAATVEILLPDPLGNPVRVEVRSRVWLESLELR